MVGTGPASYIRGMPLRPPMPTTLPPLVDAFEETVLAVIELGRGCSAADFELPTACPGWTVKDQISHVADIESILDDVIFLKDGKVVVHEPADQLREERGMSIDGLFREVFKC